MQPGKYPRILPAAPVIRAGQASASSSPGGTGSTGKEPAKRRMSSQPRPGACIECRARKTKCDGTRPACSHCAKRGQAACVYPERLVNGHKAIEFIELLKSVSEERSTSLLKRLREKGDLTIVLAEYRGGAEDGGSPSKLEAWGSRQRQISLEGELMAHYQKAFPFLRPIDPKVLARSHLLRHRPPSSGSSQAAYSYFCIEETVLTSDIPAERNAENDANFGAGTSDFLDPPQQPIEYCDERLQHLKVDFWTDIKVSNDFAARVISLYIRTDQPLLGLFDTSLFITDLVGQRTRYCSRFLFHALMYLGCQMYSAFDEDAMPYANGFCQTAEALWKHEKDSCLAMAGAILLSISLMGHGKDHAVLRYATDAMMIGTRLGLFSDIKNTANAHQSSVGVSDDNMRAQCHAAWGVFNWNVMVSMFYRQPGSESPASAPTVPIPGEIGSKGRHNGFEVDGYVLDGEDEEEEEAEEEEEGDLPEEVIARRAFPVLCNFWRIVYEARWIYYAVQGSPPAFLRTNLVEYAYRELIAWVETIPPLMLRRQESPHHVVVFHIWLHTAILDMWQPFVYKTEEELVQLKTFTAQDCTPDAAYAASVNQLKHLIVEYRSRHAASTYSILWHNGLIYLANSMLRCKDPEWRLYLLLCIYGYERLNRTYRISEVITQGLLTMTMRDKDMSGAEAIKIMDDLKKRGLVHIQDDLEDNIRATFMVDINLALTNPEAAKVENMASSFADLAAFQDLVDLDPMET
ncbi:hypothetical protein F4802DRAFT_606649 [Xylaria palmicola]|nr:hypothetical protein F4802DRAFT_606649 [Xylaria palmicola]